MSQLEPREKPRLPIRVRNVLRLGATLVAAGVVYPTMAFILSLMWWIVL